MKNKFQLLSMFIILVILLVSCNNKSAIIGEYHKLSTDDFNGMVISPLDNPSNTKRFTQTQSQEICDYFLNIQSEERYMPTEAKNPLASPDYAIVFHFKESDYNTSIGENYIVISLNELYETLDEVLENTTVHLVNEDIINEFEEMINKLVEDN